MTNVRCWIWGTMCPFSCIFTFLVAKKRHNHHNLLLFIIDSLVQGAFERKYHFFWVYLHCILDFWTFEDPLKANSPPTRSIDSHPTNEVSRPPHWEVKHPKTKLFRPRHLARQESWESIYFGRPRITCPFEKPKPPSGFSGWGAPIHLNQNHLVSWLGSLIPTGRIQPQPPVDAIRPCVKKGTGGI